MTINKQLQFKGRTITTGKRPLICCPLVATTTEALVEEAQAIVAKAPDLIEWRVDFFAAIGDSDRVLEAAARIRQVIGDIPLLFTRRAEHEGGEEIALDEAQVVALYRAVIAGGQVDLIDYELSNPADYLQELKALAQQHRLALVVSYHNFDETPSQADIVQTLKDAATAGADIAKVAVMPQQPEDVLTLLSATLEADRELPVPVITMSMAAYGSLSRMFGGAFGSAVTFAVGQTSSAPGQMAVEEVRTVVDIVARQLENG